MDAMWNTVGRCRQNRLTRTLAQTDAVSSESENQRQINSDSEMQVISVLIGQKHQLLLLPLLMLFVELLAIAGQCAASQTTAKTDAVPTDVVRETGSGLVRGLRHRVLGRDVDVFLGIPFAQPPVGELRFRRPQPIPKWSHVINATAPPASCYQVIDNSFERFKGVDMWNPNTDRSEDCLYLNVWQPVSPSASRRAVMVWIYGGGFYSGTSTLELYDARILASEGDVVVVSMQYRIGALGFLYLGIPDAPGNQGLLDQRLALQWVHDNIKHFGGDENHVTVFGESAGACSASLQLLSPQSNHLFKTSIMQSAAAIAPWGVDEPAVAKTKATDLAGALKCSAGSEVDVVKCLREIEADRIVAEQGKVNDEESIIATPFVATVDGHFLVEQPIETLKRGDFKQKSIMLGVNRDEGFYFLAYSQTQHFNVTASTELTHDAYLSVVRSVLSQPQNAARAVVESVAFEYGAPYYSKQSAAYRKVLDDIMGDVAFKCPVIDTALYYANSSSKVAVYLYDFNHRTSANPWPDWMGVMHGYEIDHVFGMPLNKSLTYTTDEDRLSRRMIRYWTNFAKTGDPNQNADGSTDSRETAWPTYTANDRQVLLLETPNVSVKTGLRDRQCDFWRDVVTTLRSSVHQDSCNATTAPGSRSSSLHHLFLLVAIWTTAFNH